MHFNPKNVNAAIVTCGGLCPGLNNVVREITNALVHLYGIGGKIWGIRGGYNGFVDEVQYPPIELTPGVVEDIHHSGGTILSSSRGGFDLEKILAFLKKRRINQLYVIGGDGTHRGAFRIHEGCMEAGMNVAVAGIPKTIDVRIFCATIFESIVVSCNFCTYFPPNRDVSLSFCLFCRMILTTLTGRLGFPRQLRPLKMPFEVPRRRLRAIVLTVSGS